MTKKDYKAIAEVLKRTREELTQLSELSFKVENRGFPEQKSKAAETREEILDLIAFRLADLMKQDNARFDYDKFFKASGVK